VENFERLFAATAVDSTPDTDNLVTVRYWTGPIAEMGLITVLKPKLDPISHLKPTEALRE
jgi:hypothetical protein